MSNVISADYVKGTREINLELTVKDAEYLFTANESVKKKAASGELQKLHKQCDDLASKVDTSYLKTMDLLSRTENQINTAENDIYEELQSTHEDLSSLRFHAEGLTNTDCFITADNFALVQAKF